MSAKQHQRNDDERKKVGQDVDQQGFNWHIWSLMALGFFTNSYSLCSMTAALPSIAFSNWKRDDIDPNELKIKTAILTGSIIGQLLFSYLADRYGRLKFYSSHFFSLTFLTLYFAQSSSGYNSMPMMGLLMFWSFFAGVFNGAGHPLAATITAEFAPVQSRARMMAAVFLMQPLGQFAVSAMSLLTLVTVGRSRGLAIEKEHAMAFSVVDNMWRLVVAIGAVPAFMTFIFQFTLPRYTPELDNNHFSQSKSCEVQSIAALSTGHNEVEGTLLRSEIDLNEKLLTVATNEGRVDGLEVIHMQHEPKLKPLSYNGINEYFCAQGNWRRLVGTSMCWFLFGIVYSGLGISNPQILAQVWTPLPLANSKTNFPRQLDPAHSNTSTYEAFMQDSIQRIITISAGPLLGSIILVTIVDYVPRKKMLVWSFLGLAILFAIAGGCLFHPPQVDLQPLKVTLYIVCQILCNLGPNALLFITNQRDFFKQISTEIFPTCYRTTCHGISAAFGTFGSLLLTLCIGIDDINDVGLHWILIGSSIFMASSAAFAWAWIPDVQDPRRLDKSWKIPSKTLEALGTGYIGVKAKEI